MQRTALYSHPQHVLALLLLWLVPVASTHAAYDVTLSWSASAGGETAGYKIHYGANPLYLDHEIDVGNTTVATVTDLSEHVRYFFVVTAYSGAGGESDPSNQLSAPIPQTYQPPERYADWIRHYFTEAELAAPDLSRPQDDADQDGIANLQEFGFNLNPKLSEYVTMAPDNGLAGLPLGKVENVGSFENRLTIEFVRRIASTDIGLTYEVQFATDLEANDWVAASGPETVEPLNSLWERVKFGSDSQSALRFGRVLVIQAPP